jgi:hypothetical protein
LKYRILGKSNLKVVLYIITTVVDIRGGPNRVPLFLRLLALEGRQFLLFPGWQGYKTSFQVSDVERSDARCLVVSCGGVVVPVVATRDVIKR